MKTNSLQTRARIAVYAEVLADAAKASDNLYTVANDFDGLLSTIRSSFELRKVLDDTDVPEQVKKTIVADIFTGFAPELLSMFDVMIERDDLSLLARVYEAYILLAEAALGATIIDVTTVVPLDESLRQQIKEKYAAQLGTDVLLREHIDPKLIGGIVLSAHGKRIDASVLSQLENARQTLIKT